MKRSYDLIQRNLPPPLDGTYRRREKRPIRLICLLWVNSVRGVCRLIEMLPISDLEQHLSIEDPYKPTAQHIAIPGDVLVPDAEFCAEVLNGATRRTARRLDHEGLPYVIVRGLKFRPLNEGRSWLAGRIQRTGQRSQHGDGGREMRGSKAWGPATDATVTGPTRSSLLASRDYREATFSGPAFRAGGRRRRGIAVTRDGWLGSNSLKSTSCAGVPVQRRG